MNKTTQDIQEKIMKYLEDCYWTSGRDNNLILDFISDFFESLKNENNNQN